MMQSPCLTWHFSGCASAMAHYHSILIALASCSGLFILPCLPLSISFLPLSCIVLFHHAGNVSIAENWQKSLGSCHPLIPCHAPKLLQYPSSIRCTPRQCIPAVGDISSSCSCLSHTHLSFLGYHHEFQVPWTSVNLQCLEFMIPW